MTPICAGSLDAVCQAMYGQFPDSWVYDYSTIRYSSPAALGANCYGHSKGGDLPTNNYATAKIDLNPITCAPGYTKQLDLPPYLRTPPHT